MARLILCERATHAVATVNCFDMQHLCQLEDPGVPGNGVLGSAFVGPLAPLLRMEIF